MVAMLVYTSLYTEMTSALSWLGVGAAALFVASNVQAIENVVVVIPSCAVTTIVVVPGMLVAAVTTALAFVSVVVAATVGTTVVSAGNSTE